MPRKPERAAGRSAATHASTMLQWPSQLLHVSCGASAAAEPAQANPLRLTVSLLLIVKVCPGNDQGTEHTAAEQEALALPGSEERCPLASPTSTRLSSASLLRRGNSAASIMFYIKGLSRHNSSPLQSACSGAVSLVTRPLCSTQSHLSQGTAALSPLTLHRPHTSPPAAGKAACGPRASIIGGQLARPRLTATPPLPRRAAETQHWYCLQDGLQPCSWAGGTVNSNQIPNELCLQISEGWVSGGWGQALFSGAQ